MIKNIASLFVDTHAKLLALTINRIEEASKPDAVKPVCNADGIATMAAAQVVNIGVAAGVIYGSYKLSNYLFGNEEVAA